LIWPEMCFRARLRHCFASTALANGIPITEMAQWLGHRSIEMTHRIYGNPRAHLMGSGARDPRPGVPERRRVERLGRS